MMTKKVKFTLAAVVVIVITSLCPVFTSVSGRTKITILREGNVPIAGAQIRQWWDVYGWGGIRGSAAATADSDGTIFFPPRKSVGFLGVRLFNQAGAFITQCSAMLVFGGFAYGYTERWGPIVGIDIDLPPGNWLPASWRPASSPSDDLFSAHIDDGPHRYIYIRNTDPLHSSAYISGDALGFVGDTEVVLRLRKATAEEDVFIRDNRACQYALQHIQRSK